MRITEYVLHLDGDRKPSLVKEVSHNYPDLCRLDSPEKIRVVMNSVYKADVLAEEYMWAIAFNTKCVPLGMFEISHGTANYSLVTPREVFIRMLLCGAVSFVLVHNHPSGDATPSEDDIKTTKRMQQEGEMVNVPLLDHVIIGNGYCYSFKEEGLL